VNPKNATFIIFVVTSGDRFQSSIYWYKQKYSSQNFCICSLVAFVFLTLIYFKHAPETITSECN